MSFPQAFVDPSSIAVVGATEDRAKWGYWLATGALAGADRRQVWLVNRRAAQVLGQPCDRRRWATCRGHPDLRRRVRAAGARPPRRAGRPRQGLSRVPRHHHGTPAPTRPNSPRYCTSRARG
ncbi:CoA-binding protein [Streptomyces sp. L7]